MPICSKCGCYFSEKSCPFCTPDDSPDSPVSTIEVETSKPVRIIDPSKLIDSIEEAEGEITSLKDSKEKEIEQLREEMRNQEELELKIKTELEELDSQLSELQSSIKEMQEKKDNLIQGKTELEQEVKDLKSKLSELNGQVLSKVSEISQLKAELGGS
jgi:chromosome segregation ATPase